MAEATTSRYESNYIKIAMVILRISSRAVRVQFDKEFDPGSLRTTWNSKQGLLSDLKKKKRITEPQWKLLYPGKGEHWSNDFDITLMICLLRNLKHIEIMDSLPSATDTSLRADLSRMKFYRNMIVHCNSGLVNDTDFNSYWNDVTPAILRLGGNSLKVECDDWYGRNFDGKQRGDGIKCIKAEQRLALVDEELAEMKKKQTDLNIEHIKQLADTNKKLRDLEHEKENLKHDLTKAEKVCKEYSSVAKKDYDDLDDIPTPEVPQRLEEFKQEGLTTLVMKDLSLMRTVEAKDKEIQHLNLKLKDEMEKTRTMQMSKDLEISNLYAQLGRKEPRASVGEAKPSNKIQDGTMLDAWERRNIFTL